MIRGSAAALLLLLTGCAAFAPGPPRDALGDEALSAALAELLCRVEPDCRKIRLHVIDRAFPQAEMFPDGRLLINIGMLTATRSEAEIAFVLAHELAHRRLRHLPASSAEAKARVEIEADAFAVDRLQASGLQPGAGHQLLVRLLDLSRADTPGEVRPKKSESVGSDLQRGKDAEVASVLRQQTVQEGLEQLEQRIRAIEASVGIDAAFRTTAGDQLWQQRLLPYRSERADD